MSKNLFVIILFIVLFISSFAMMTPLFLGFVLDFVKDVSVWTKGIAYIKAGAILDHFKIKGIISLVVSLIGTLMTAKMIYKNARVKE